MSESATSTPVTGGCLCGRVRYEARIDDRKGYYCHCRMCQLAFGNVRVAYFNLRRDRVRWTGEPPTEYASSKIARRGFCGTCGTPLSFHFLDSERMDLSVGSLDDPGALKPTEHWGVESRVASWHVPDGLPEHRIDENERIMQRWRQAYGHDTQPGVDTAKTQA
ncbi:MAG: GFA family protein [Pseudomonadota bacterium]